MELVTTGIATMGHARIRIHFEQALSNNRNGRKPFLALSDKRTLERTSFQLQMQYSKLSEERHTGTPMTS